ncbi:MAG: putative toxin-antitoxin system toxin component, PIN family [Bacteroidota bacterium]
MNYKFVFDTNTLISAALLKQSINARALDLALDLGRIVVSEPVLEEFTEVIFRKKFDKYLSDEKRLEAISRIEKNSLIFFPKEKISACRDPKDNKFLELAMSANAACIVTGDQDLLVLNPFDKIPILSPNNFMQEFNLPDRS